MTSLESGIVVVTEHVQPLEVAPVIDETREPILSEKAFVGNRYGILRKLHVSPAAETYRAKDYSEKYKDVGDVALKLFLESDAERIKHTDRELAAMALFSELPGFPTLRDTGILEHNDVEYRYAATNFIEGGTVADILSRENPKGQQAVDLFFNVMPDAVQHSNEMHEAGLIHGDIKPSNISHYKETLHFGLLDFGGVDAIPDAEAPFVIVEGTGALPVWNPDQKQQHAVSTEGFAPLECTRNDMLRGPRADVHMLAATGHRILTGRYSHPVSKDNPRVFLNAVENDPVEYAQDVNPFVPKDAADLLVKCQNPDAGKRYDGEEMLERLLAAKAAYYRKIAA